MKAVAAFLAFGLASVAAFPSGGAERDYTDPDQLATLIAQKTEPYLLVDVRTPAEYESGHIPTSVNIPNTEIAARPPSVEKGALIIVYCRSGNRSATARKELQAMGFTRVVDFGAVSKWKGQLVLGGEPGGK